MIHLHASEAKKAWQARVRKESTQVPSPNKFQKELLWPKTQFGMKTPGQEWQQRKTLLEEISKLDLKNLGKLSYKIQASSMS